MALLKGGNRESYTCPICGKKALLGSHFCKVKDAGIARNLAEPQDSDLAQTKAELRKKAWRGVSILAAFLLILAFLWSQIGPWSILLMLGGPALIVAAILLSKAVARLPRQRYKQLLRLIGHDRAAASRLIAREKMAHPERSLGEHIESVISSLDRDRR